MRLVVKDFSVSPNNNLVIIFDESHGLALKALDSISGAIDQTRAENIVSMRKDVTALRKNFDDLVREQKILGYDDASGLRGNLHTAGNAVERIINENMSWLAKDDATKLMMTLLFMRHYEADYRVDQDEVARQQFERGYKKFTDTFAIIDGTPQMKSSLEQQVKTYADTFQDWVEGYGRVRPIRAIIDIDSQHMLPRADEIIQYARDTADDAARRLEKSQARTRTGIIMVGIAMVALGLGFSWLIGRSITRPLNGLATVMKRLADGDTTARIPATARARRNRRDGAHRHRIPRQHDRARTPGADADRGKPRARAAQRRDRAHNFAIQAFRRKRAEHPAHRIDEAGNEFCRPQQGGRHGLLRGRYRQESRVRRVGKRHRGGKLGRGTGGIDRRNRVASRKINRRRRPCRFGSAAHRHDDEGAWQRRNPHRRSRRPDPGDRRANQPPRAERNNRGGTGRRIRQGVSPL